MAHIPHGEFLLEQLRKQRERGFLCDCTVVIGQARYEAHHNVLAAFSEYFSTQCIDAGREDATITLDPEWVNSTVFEKLLDYMYTGNLNMDGDEILNVQNTASYLGIQEVLALCSAAKDSPIAVTDTILTDPRSPLSPDDYEPLEPLEEVEEREMLRKEEEKKSGMFQEKVASLDDFQFSSEQTPQGSEKRIRKPRTRLYEEEDESTKKESPQFSPRGRGRGRGRPRGRPRTRPLDSDKADVVVMDKSPITETAVVRRGTGRPRGRPRTRPLSSEAVDSACAEENSTVANNEEMATGTEQSEASKSLNPQGDTEVVNNVNNEEVENKAASDTENPKVGVVTKRGRGRPRTKSLPSESNDIQNPEDMFTQILQKEGSVRKRGRPRSKPLPSEMPESDNTEGGTEQDEGPDQENNQPIASSSEPFDDQQETPQHSKMLRTSTRKRSLSRKLRESQASNDENEQDEAAEEEGSEDWEEEKDVQVLQDKLRPICNICGNLFSEMSSLRRHMRIHKGLKPYQCQLCGRCFRQGNQLKTHLRIHTGEKPFSCSCCDASFAQKCQLVYHCRMHHGEEKPHKCDVCPAAFATSSNLKIHMRTHSGEKPYECGECGKRFTQASTLMYHKRRHTGEKPYVCDTCGMAFAVSSSLISHTRKHTGVTPYICLDCGKPCLTSGELRKHMDIHNGSRRVICNICGSTLSDIYSLKKHQALRHKAPTEQDDEPKKPESVECPINIPIDHQGLIARVRSVLSESPEPSFPDESPLTSEASMIIHQPETPMIIKHSDGTEAPMIIQHSDASGTQMISGSPMIIQHAESSEAPMIIQHAEAGGTPMIIQHSEAGGTPMIIQHSEAGGTPMIFQHSEGSDTPLIIQHADSSGAQMISGSPMIIQHADSSETPMIIQHSEATGSPMIIQHDESTDTPVLIQHGESGEQVSYVVEQYEIPGSSDLEHAQIVIVQTID
ncbi:myoneurin [Tachysurus fulvidraco]|uniref:myoneurin n=1 Tax=Tachysurus fulvidraco TaxID=1234273 RepID=UPI000F4EB4B0|nr:myoneurin [Tachysurus fulvidraco]XP_027029552.1 myoneurin [Tachysurus fulvidraco]XP_047664454.1 myoneurin [Tachysurus fulvidraco]